MLPWLSKSIQTLRQKIISQVGGVCLVCRQAAYPEARLCHDCQSTLVTSQRRCTLCGQPLSLDHPVCGHCLSHPPPWDRLFVACDYQSPLDQMILALKFHHQSIYAALLADLLLPMLRTQSQLPSQILPLPLHWIRKMGRGYNQAELIASHLGHELQIPLNHHALKRQRATTAQSQLSRQQRRKNIKGAFTLQKSCAPHIALVDDVITTGSTLREVTRVLKKNGVKRVELWVPCITPTRQRPV